MEHITSALALRSFSRGLPGVLVLEDGRCFPGVSVGYEGLATGEVVFNPAGTGYQGVLTDPSNAGQIVAMTCPQIGNVGINPEDDESTVKPPIRGCLMRELSSRVSNWRATESLPDFLLRHQIVALSEVDTRSITQHLRSHGTKRGVIASGDWNAAELVQKAKDSPRLEDIDLVEQLSVSAPVEWSEPSCTKKIVVLDFGVKQSIVRSLLSLGANVVLVPAQTSAEDILKLQPDGVVLSSGPGDPARLDYAVAEIAKLLGTVPIFGIALGHQLLARAFGATTSRLPFGHRGTQPVVDKLTGKVAMTSQNHGFCVDTESLPSEVEVSHVNLHDGTVEGLRHRSLPVVSVQFHPEGGPRDAAPIFEQFLRSIV
ncbi:MAG: glutamine-hydrolyzing carbamoyl-phosphate synthase small subunit [Planctomycetaceae bacterium]|nr:glutamine-hydrolyzing carbamoyl-phosphate synthase small subunit [Planctomycetaceae bacterium]